MKHKHPTKNSLSIRLTESAVFLRTDAPNGRPRRNPETRSSLLRGLLTLDLIKPTKITSIDVELQAVTSTAWPEGIGARRIEVTEEHRIFHASTLYFRASKARRTASIGPGVVLNPHEHDAHDWEDDLDDDEGDFDGALTRTPRGGFHVPIATPSSTSGSSNAYSMSARLPNALHAHTRRVSVDSSTFQRTPLAQEYYDVPIPPYSPTDPNSPGREAAAVQSLEEFRASLNFSMSRRPNSSAVTPISSSSSSSSSTSLTAVPSSTNTPILPVAIPSRSLSRRTSPLMDDVPEHEDPAGPSTPRAERSRSQSHLRGRGRSSTPAGSVVRSVNADGSGDSAVGHSSNSNHVSVSASASGSRTGSAVNRNGNGNAASVNTRDGGRKHSKFSFSAVSSVLKDAVRSTQMSPMTAGFQIREKEQEADRSRSRDGESRERTGRGRTMERGEGVGGALVVGGDVGASASARTRGSTSASSTSTSRGPVMRVGAVGGAVGFGVSMERERGGGQGQGQGLLAKPSEHRSREIGRIFGAGFDDPSQREKSVKENKDGNGNGWKEFKKGTYTYPISFSIPGNAPPSLQCEYGSVVWRLRASVHRPGAFKSKLTATREVVMIACPTEEDTEDTENIIVERHWDQQLQYLISISGRSFYVGGTVPVTFVLMPLMKAKIYRLSVYIEERVDYYTHMHRIARSDPITRIELLSIKGEGKVAGHILPLDSDDVDAFRKSPLYAVVNPEDDESEVASSLMGPGPWTFHQNLKLPSSCDLMKFTNKNRRANITVSHLLKCVMRVERGDDAHVDAKTGKRKLFDIVVQTPVHILSCRCNPEWTSLPRYSETLDDDTLIIPNCPCQVQRMMRHNTTSEFHIGFRAHLPTALERITSRQSSDSSASPAETSTVNPVMMRSLRHNNNAPLVSAGEQFERLISGQESVFGEAPPTYSVAKGVAVAVR